MHRLSRKLWTYPRAHYALRRFKRTALATLTREGLAGDATLARKELRQIQRILAREENGRRLRSRADGPRVLFFCPHGTWATHVATEAVIALALRLRGARCEFLTCGAVQPICIQGGRSAARCASCFHYVQDFIIPFGLPLRSARGLSGRGNRAGDGTDFAAYDLDGLLDYNRDGLPLGRMILPSVRWVLRRGTLLPDERTLATYRAFLQSAVVMLGTFRELLRSFSFDVIFCLNGDLLEESILCALARQKDVRLVSYERGFRPDTLFFAHDAPACRYNVDGLWPHYAARSLSAKEARVLDAYLASRRRGVRGIGGVVFWPSIEHDQRIVRERLGLDDRPIATLFTNVLFDTAVQNREVAFRDVFDWLDSTIRQFAANPGWQLVIRVHPSEVRDVNRESLEPVAQWIGERFPSLPDHIKIVPPESDLSSYTLINLSRVGLVYSSTIGLEMALVGKPVIMAGEHHYRGKGFTDDASSSEDYRELVRRRLASEQQLSPAQLELARRYAYFFFFRAMIPFKLVTEPRRGQVRFNFDSLNELLPGRDHGLDVICDGILDGRSFVV